MPTTPTTEPRPEPSPGDDSQAPPQKRRGTRTPKGLFAAASERSTRADKIAVGVIGACVVICVAVVLGTGSARTVHHEAAAEPQPEYSPAHSDPQELQELWSTPSLREGAPLVSDGNVFSTTENGIQAWEAGVQNAEWSYSRSGTLCASQFFSGEIVTVFTGPAGCSDATAFDASTGEYSSGRQSAFADHMTLWGNGSNLLALGPDRLEVWRDDLVRTVEYGAVAAPQEKNQQPRHGCGFQSANLDSEDFVVAEKCPEDPEHVRVTVSSLVPEDSRVPEEETSVLTEFSQFHLIGLTEGRESVGVAERDGQWMVVRLSAAGRSEILENLDGEPALLPSPETVAQEPGQFRWFDGRSTHAYDARNATSQWVMDNVTGPGHGLGTTTGTRDGSGTAASAVLVPSTSGVVLAGVADGAIRATLPMDAAPSADHAVVGLSQIGNILYAQHDGTLTAYKMVGSE
ncbi:Rv3212 family protein [Dietzia sp.]|uniref:Rv3212 family protein n=1 Tax=Dietzia sp. TaxID=1871616 RepID=UPI002FD8FA09